MIMKTRTLLMSAAIAAVLNIAPVNAQILGGNATGGLGGTLSGGTRDMSAITRGGANGSFGGELDAGSLSRTTSGVTDRAGNRVHDTAGAARTRTRSKLGEVQGASKSAANASANAAGNTLSATRNIESTAAVTGSAVSAASIDSHELNGAADAVASKQVAAQPAMSAPVNGDVVSRSALDSAVQGSNSTQPMASNVQSGLTGATDGAVTGSGSSSPMQSAANHQLLADSSAHGGASGEGSIGKSPVNFDAQGEGSAKGNATASKDGVSARPSASAQGSGSANVSAQR
jgi:hypothetical protein